MDKLLELLRSLEARAAAKLAEVKDGLADDQVRSIEDDHASILSEIADTKAKIAEAKAERSADVPVVNDAAVRAAANAAVDAERKRASTIRDLARSANWDKATDLGEAHAALGTSIDAFRGLLLDLLVTRTETTPINGNAPVIEVTRDEVDTRRAAISNAILHRFDGTSFKLTDAGREWRNMNLLEIVKEGMRANGEKTRGMSDIQIAERAFHSTSDFPVILGDVVRTTLLDGYKSYENTFQLIAKRNTVTDFKEIRRARLGANPELKKVNESGEFTRGSMVEGSESYKIATYGRVIGMTRQMLINDQLNAFADVPRRWGRQVAKLEGDIVWGLVVANAAMSSDNKALFHADHKNLGTAAALGLVGLKAGRMAFRKQTDIDGNRIDLAPKYLFTPTDLEVDAQQLLQSTTSPTKTEDVIPEAIRSLTPVAEHRLDAISDKVWFLFANPADTDGGLEYAYLAGHEAPHTEERIGFDSDGVDYRVRHDFGAGLTDWRFAYKNPGA